MQWALARFDRAGLELPRVESITFTRFSDYCADLDGLAIPSEGDHRNAEWGVVLCLSEDEVCDDPGCARYNTAVKRTVLHELAHVWMEQFVPEPTKAAFMSWRGLQTWDGHATDWARSAAEHGAEFITWGLLGSGYAMVEVGLPSVDERVTGFQLLTGRQPLQPTAD